MDFSTSPQTASAIIARLGLGSIAAGGLAVASSPTQFTPLAIGGAGQLLTSTGTAPAWSGTGLTYSGGKLTLTNTAADSIRTAGGVTAASSIVALSASLTRAQNDVSQRAHVTMMRGDGSGSNATISTYGDAANGVASIAAVLGGTVALSIAPTLIHTPAAVTSIVIGTTAALASERVRITGGTMGAPGATDVLIAAGRVYAGDTGTASIQAAGGITQDAASFHYWGPEGTDGSWRYGRSGNNFVIERRESGSWITKQTIAA